MFRARFEIVLVCLAVGSTTRGDERAPALPRNQLDQAVARVGPSSAPPASDATFLRRAYLDLAGRIPSAETARAFLDDDQPDKRARLVARLLASEEFNDHWGRVLATIVLGERPVYRETYDGRTLHEFLRDRLAERARYNRVIRELVAGSGASDTSGPANFLLRSNAEPTRLAGALGKNVLGITVQCAQCHDHPFARWKQDDFWGLAANFARVRKLEGNDDLKAIVEARRGELTRPEVATREAEADDEDEDDEEKPSAPKQVTVRPRLLDGKPVPLAGRREALADWVAAAENPYLARNLVNRVWGQLFGKTLVANLDGTPADPRAGEVLDLLANDFTAHGHDLRRLLETIVLSRTYGEACVSDERPRWARANVRPMSVDQLHASIARATGFDGEPDPPTEEPAGSDDDGLPNEPEPDNTDRPEESLTERALTLQRALILINGDHVEQAARSAAKVARATLGKTSDAARIEHACLATLARKPTAAEIATLLPLLATPGGLEDVYWVLLNSSEFQFIP